MNLKASGRAQDESLLLLSPEKPWQKPFDIQAFKPWERLWSWHFGWNIWRK